MTASVSGQEPFSKRAVAPQDPLRGNRTRRQEAGLVAPGGEVAVRLESGR
jgi:hypothetical protein